MTVVNAEWRFLTEFLYQHLDTANPREWYFCTDVPVEGTVQFYLADEGGEEQPPQVISADVDSPTTLTIERLGDGLGYTRMDSLKHSGDQWWERGEE